MRVNLRLWLSPFPPPIDLSTHSFCTSSPQSPPFFPSIPPQDVERVFCYLFTTSEGDVQESVMGKGANAAPGNKSVPLAGLGACCGALGTWMGGKPKQSDSLFLFQFNLILKSPSHTIPRTGYGLPIARNYSRYFGGDLSIQSDHGKGCTVTVTLNQLGECKERFV